MTGKRVIVYTFLGVVAGVMCWLGSHDTAEERAFGEALNKRGSDTAPSRGAFFNNVNRRVRP